METKFSVHAFFRVLGRMSMRHEELATLLDEGMFVNIGCERNTNRVHKVFYSRYDKMCFVAIQDTETGTVVTVLPIDYHNNISWRVSFDVQTQAKRIIINGVNHDIDAEMELANKKYTPGNRRPKSFQVKGDLLDEYNKYIKTLVIGHWPSKRYDYNINKLLSNETFLTQLTEKIKNKTSMEIGCIQYIPIISIKLGLKGKPIYFETNDIIVPIQQLTETDAG